jgi:hypothetical protein
MSNKFDTTPRLMHPLIHDNVEPQPGFTQDNLNNLSSIMAESLPQTRFILVGYLAQVDARSSCSTPKVQKLDIDLFLHVTKTDSARWDEIDKENQVGGSEHVVMSKGFTYISPELSALDESTIKKVVSESLASHLPPEHVFSHIGRTGEPLTVVGENVREWGNRRRQQPIGHEKPYLEIVPLITSGEESFLDDELAMIGISPDLSPRYCSFYGGEYSPLDLHIHRPQIRRHGFYGLPDLNWDYLNKDPINSLHWIRREVKALSLYQQLDPEYLLLQLEVFSNHIQTLVAHNPQILKNTKYIEKITRYLDELGLSPAVGFPTPVGRLESSILPPVVTTALG